MFIVIHPQLFKKYHLKSIECKNVCFIAIQKRNKEIYFKKKNVVVILKYIEKIVGRIIFNIHI